MQLWFTSIVKYGDINEEDELKLNRCQPSQFVTSHIESSSLKTWVSPIGL